MDQRGGDALMGEHATGDKGQARPSLYTEHMGSACVPACVHIHA